MCEVCSIISLGKGTKMKPLNRRLLIEVLNQEEESSGAFFVPQEKKAQSEFTIGMVVDSADDCTSDLKGKKVVFTTFGIETVKVGVQEFSFIGESHVVCCE